MVRPQAGVSTPDKDIHYIISPEGTTEYSATPSGFVFVVAIFAGDESPACILSAPRALFLGLIITLPPFREGGGGSVQA